MYHQDRSSQGGAAGWSRPGSGSDLLKTTLMRSNDINTYSKRKIYQYKSQCNYVHLIFFITFSIKKKKKS